MLSSMNPHQQQNMSNRFQQTLAAFDVSQTLESVSSGDSSCFSSPNHSFGFIPSSPEHSDKGGDFSFIPSSPAASGKTISSDQDQSTTSLSLHDVHLEAELAMLQHAYSSEENSQPPSSPESHSPVSNNGWPQQQINQYPQQQMHPGQQQQMNMWQRLQQEEAWRRAIEQNSLTNLMSLQTHHETSQAALGLLYDYYHQQQQVQQPRKPIPQQAIPTQQTVKQQAPVLVKSEPLDSDFVTQKPDNLKKTCELSDIKKEATGGNNTTTTSPNAGLPENYKGEYFEYSMEAPRSLKQKEGEPTMSYINKAQFYSVNLREVGGAAWPHSSTKVKTVVSVVFGDGKPEDEQLRHWRYWHGRQHTAKQRVIDIADYKESSMVTDIHEFAHNAISFNWDVRDAAKIFVSVNCLSTDFSAQKGIKGLPLLLQIDTYTDMRRNAKPVHRGLTQIKVFCDKGAERKIRDEERKAIRKKSGSNSKNQSSTTQQQAATTQQQPLLPHQIMNGMGQQNGPIMHGSKRHEMVYFKASADLGTAVTYFIPELQCRTEADYLAAGEIPPLDYETRKRALGQEHDSAPIEPTLKKKRSDDSTTRVLLYIRESDSDVYDALMLESPDLAGLTKALCMKYQLSADHIDRIYKKSKKGIILNMDDIVIRHYANEDTFIIQRVPTVNNKLKIIFEQL